MKIFRAIVIISLNILYGCGYNNFDSLPSSDRNTIVPNMDISLLKTYYNGSPVRFDRDIVIAGYVTANDASGNFYRTLIIQDKSGAAVEIKAGFNYVANSFPVGRYVAVKLKGLYLGSYNSVLQIGCQSYETGLYDTDYFYYRSVFDHHVLPAWTFGKTEPLLTKVGDLEEELCGSLVRVNGLTIGEDEINVWTLPLGEETYGQTNFHRIFTDDEGNSIAVLTSIYADFARSVIPEDKIDITGILMKGRISSGKEMFILKLRDLNDIEVN